MIGGIRKADNSHGIIVGHDLNISEVVAQLGLTMNTVPTPHRMDYSTLLIRLLSQFKPSVHENVYRSIIRSL